MDSLNLSQSILRPHLEPELLQTLLQNDPLQKLLKVDEHVQNWIGGVVTWCK
jgi:hypothetical protein